MMNAFAKITMVGVALAAGALGAAAQNSPAKQGDPAKERDRLICRSMPVSGTLAGRRRQCFTRAQWDRIAQGAQKQTVDLQGSLPSGQIAN
jgi:hypothetical protein